MQYDLTSVPSHPAGQASQDVPGSLYLPASQSKQSVDLELPVATVFFPPRQFSHFRLAGKMLYIPRLQSVQIPAELPTFPAGQSSQPIPLKYINVGHLPLQLISSFSTVVKEDEEPAGHSEQECSTVNGVTNGWDMKLSDGQHPRRVFEPDRTSLNVLYLSPHKVRLNPAELNTANHKENVKYFQIKKIKKISIKMGRRKLEIILAIYSLL